MSRIWREQASLAKKAIVGQRPPPGLRVQKGWLLLRMGVSTLRILRATLFDVFSRMARSTRYWATAPNMMVQMAIQQRVAWLGLTVCT